MSSAPTPAPHVPVNFLKAGGTSFFSAKCLALLAAYGYEGDDFGSYDHVARRLSTARERVAAHDAAVAAGRTPPPPQPPTARERELGAPTSDPLNTYQSGHLGMNTCMQGTRDDPCSNFVYGHDMGNYPCMPHQGSALEPGTEHNRWTQREVDTPLSRDNAEPRGPYSGDINADADARTRALLAERGQRPQPTGTDGATGASVTAASAADPNAAGTAGGAAAGTAARPVMGESDKITGDDAAECINNFRKGAEAGMRSHCADSETIRHNRQVAGTAAQRDAARATAASTRATADALEGPMRSANSSVAGRTGSLNAAQNATGGVPTQAQADLIDQRQANLDAAVANRNALRTQADAANTAAGTAQSVSSRRDNAHCRAEQGERIQEGAAGELGARNPNAWDDLPRTPLPTAVPADAPESNM